MSPHLEIARPLGDPFVQRSLAMAPTMDEPAPTETAETDLFGEAELVDRLRGGDPAAFDQFAHHYLPGLLRFARAQLRSDPELARDIAQTTVCKALKALGRFRGDAPLALWLRTCCRNEISSHFRRNRRRPMLVAFDPGGDEPAPQHHLQADDPGPEQRLLDAEDRDLVHLALDQLPSRYAAAVEWRYLEGLDVPEVATRLDLGYKAAESLLSRARAAFRAAYSQLRRGSRLSSGDPTP